MHFSEDDLRQALQRQDPGARFTQRVMAAVNQAEAEGKNKSKAPLRRDGFFARILALRLRPALAGAVATLMLLAGGSLAYWEHAENERERATEMAKAKEAEQQAILALRITNAKLNRVFQRVRESQGNDSKIRRERL